MLPIDAFSVDVLCVNCYECIKVENVDQHSIECVKTLSFKPEVKLVRKVTNSNKMNH